MQNSKKPNWMINLVIIAILVVLALGVLTVSRLIASPNASLSQTEIEDTIQSLVTQTPEPESTEAPQPEAADAPQAEEKELAPG